MYILELKHFMKLYLTKGISCILFQTRCYSVTMIPNTPQVKQVIWVGWITCA